MKTVIVTSEAGKAFLRDMQERKKANEKRIRDRMPPREISAMIEKKTNETFEMNKGNLDKQAFRLGMYAMWFEMRKEFNASTSPAT